MDEDAGNSGAGGGGMMFGGSAGSPALFGVPVCALVLPLPRQYAISAELYNCQPNGEEKNCAKTRKS